MGGLLGINFLQVSHEVLWKEGSVLYGPSRGPIAEDSVPALYCVEGSRMKLEGEGRSVGL